MSQSKAVPSKSWGTTSKEKLSIAEIVKLWAQESGQSPEKILNLITERAKTFHFNYYDYHHFPPSWMQGISQNLLPDEKEKQQDHTKEISINDFISKRAFFYWLRWEDGSDDLKSLGGLAYFWGDPWEDSPKSWDPKNENTEYSLYNGFTYLMAPQDYYELTEAYRLIPEYDTPSERNMDYLPVDNTQSKNPLAAHYNLALIKAREKFTEHLKEGRLEMKGFYNSIPTIQSIPVELAITIIMDGHTDFKKSSACIGNMPIGGIKIYKVVKEKTDKKPENTKNIIRNEIEEYIKIINKKKINIDSKEDFANRLLKHCEENGKINKEKTKLTTAVKYIEDWKFNIYPKLWCFKKQT